MSRIIFKCPYIKPGTEKSAAHLNSYIRYIATRVGAGKLKPDNTALPATKKQRAMVERLLRDFPMCRGMFEYEDYQSSPTRAAAYAPQIADDPARDPHVAAAYDLWCSSGRRYCGPTGMTCRTASCSPSRRSSSGSKIW